MAVRRMTGIAVAVMAIMALFSSERSPLMARQPAGKPAGERGRQVWAMVVGIERYDEGPIVFPPCRGAARDAASIARFLIETAGWGQDHVLLMTDRGLDQLGFPDPAKGPEHRRPTRNALEKAAREWLASKEAPGSVLLVFFAGHAASLPSRADDPAGQGPGDFLLPIDARATDLERTGWRLGDAIEEIGARGVASVVCLLDTSPHGRLRTPSFMRRQIATGVDGERMLKGIVRWPGTTAWLAATDRPSGETNDGDGLFTRALIEHLGNRRQAHNLLACLDRLRREPTLAAQGFRSAGGFGPDLALWPDHVPIARPRLEPLLQDGHADRVTTTAFSTDGGRLFTCSMDSTVRIWRTSDGLLLRALPALVNGVESIAVGADGHLLVAGGGKGDLLFYDLVRERAKQLPGGFPHSGRVDVAVLADGRRAVTLDSEGQCLLWDAGESTVKQLANVWPSSARALTVATRPGGAAFALVTPGDGDRDLARVFDRDGKVLKPHDTPQGRITALALSDDGTRLVLGTDKGVVADFAADAKPNRLDQTFDGPVGHVKILPNWVAAASGNRIRIVPHAGRGVPTDLEPLDEPISQVAFTADGRRAAAVGQFQGSLCVWEIAADGASSRRLPLDDKVAGGGLSLSFAPGGDAVAVGDGDGRIRRWSLPEGKAEHISPPSRSRRVRHVAVAPDGKTMLQINSEDRTTSGRAILWTFGEGRGTRLIPGSFFPAGGFLPDGNIVMIDGRGNPCVLDKATLVRLPVNFARPRSNARFDSLTIAPAGRHVAAASSEGTLACVWNIADGTLIHDEIRDPDAGKINTVNYSGDGRLLLTAGDDGRVKVWDLSARTPRKKQTLEPALADANDPPGVVTAAVFSPVDPARIVVGRRLVHDGRTVGWIELWDPGATRPRRFGPLGGDIRALAISSDGAWLAAAGDDLQINLYSMANTVRPDFLGRGPNHFEAINALAFWPQGKMLVSASEDTTVRIWRIADRSLIGTFSGSHEGSDWVFFTPDGRFDATPEGERRVTWRLDQDRAGEGVVVRLEQLHDQRHLFNLADELLARLVEEKPLGPAPRPVEAAPPQLALERVTPQHAKQRLVDLRIRLSDPEVTDVRLYHNGVAVNAGLKPSGKNFSATITLVNGKNRIYALAGRQGGVDGRSNEVELAYDGAPRGRTHVLALGVSKYKKQALRFATRDAEDIAAFLGRRGIGTTDSDAKPIVILDDKVCASAVDLAFVELLRRVKNRPEDTVVVFLAGHTDVRSELFCLLLPTADLPDGPAEVAMRGPIQGDATPVRHPPPLRDPSVLPYFMIHRNLKSLDALQRLVIVDACVAESIYDDPGVRGRNRFSVRKTLDNEAYKARTSYILATRRDERSIEPAVLKHGLLTFVLLHGMGATGLTDARDLPIFQQFPTADFDSNGLIDTGELQRYVRATVPPLAQRFPAINLRGLPNRGAANGGGRAEPGVTEDVAQSAPFPLVEVAQPVAIPPGR